MSFFDQIPGFNVLMLVMLAFMTLTFTILALMTFSNAWRLRNPLLSWHSGKSIGYPLFASIFLGFIIFTAVYTGPQINNMMLPAWICYGWIGLSWFFSSFMMSKRYITDHGIVKNINDPSQTVPWSIITDYFEKDLKQGSVITFFYLPASSHVTDGLLRIEIFVPDRLKSRLNKIITYKVNGRYRSSGKESQSVINRDALH